MASSPQLRRLGAELKRLRVEAGLKQAEVANVMGRSAGSLANWERGNTKLSKADLVYFLAEVRAPADVRKVLEQLWEDANRGVGQWMVHGLPAWLRPLVTFEEKAKSIFSFAPTLVPGLLQTEEYALALHAAGRQKVAPENIDKWVAARMRRQQRLTGPERVTLTAVIAEAALRLEVGSSAILVRQLQRLHEAAQLDNISIRILPMEGVGYGGVATNFLILRFAEPKIDPPLGYFDGPLGGYIISDSVDVDTMIKMAADLQVKSLSEDDSIAKLESLITNYRPSVAVNE